MEWLLDKGRPLCPQICEQLCLHIAIGELTPGERLLSVREVALAAGVNPNTVQRSFETLEAEGILYSVRGSGWYVAEDTTLAKKTFQRILAEKTATYMASMQALGLSREAAKNYVIEWVEKEEAK